ncbi:hypothetical protein JCM3770_006496 [Rhodotorula araucariae]
MSPTGGRKPLRKSSTKGKHIVQRDPLPKGQSCTTCRQRKVGLVTRSSDDRALTHAPRRCAAPQNVPLVALVFEPPASKGGTSAPFLARQMPVLHTHQRPTKARRSRGPRSTLVVRSLKVRAVAKLAHLLFRTDATPPLANPYMSTFPAPQHSSGSCELLAAAGTAYLAPAPPHSYTPTPPLSYSSAASPDESLFAHSPPTQNASILRPPTAEELYPPAGVPWSTAGLCLPPMASEVSAHPMPYDTTNSLVYGSPAPLDASSYASVAYPTHAHAVPWPTYCRAEPVSGMYPSALPRIEPLVLATPSPAAGSATPSRVAAGYTLKKPTLAFHLPPPISFTSSMSSSTYQTPYPGASLALQRSASGSYPSLPTSQPSHGPSHADDPTFSLPLQQGGDRLTPGLAAHSPCAAFDGASSGGPATPWPALHSPGGLVWAYPAGAGASKPAVTPGFGHVDDWLRGLSA